MQRVLRAVREVAPFMRVAGLVCFVIAGLIGCSILADDRMVAARILLAVGWAAWAAALHAAAALAERYA